jgi:hypothetical protein
MKEYSIFQSLIKFFKNKGFAEFMFHNHYSKIDRLSKSVRLGKYIRHIILFLLFVLIISCNNSTNNSRTDIDYTDSSSWAYLPDPVYDVDVFFVAPTIFFGDDSTFNMDITDPELRANFKGATNMEKGIYDYETNFYAPYYRQAGLNCYRIRGYKYVSNDKNVNAAYDLAYHDISSAFDHYLSISDRDFVLAGFSQGGEMLLRLIKDKFSDKKLQDRLIAAYLIGWRITGDDLKYDHVRPAQSEDDTGVIICISTEAPFVDSTIIVPHSTASINPLSWTTDTSYADKSLNKGAVFTDYSGAIVKEIPNLTGAYICPKRGTIKVPDIDPDEYPPVLDVFRNGEYHIYDYSFFYRNLQENVKVRIEKKLE